MATGDSKSFGFATELATNITAQFRDGITAIDKSHGGFDVSGLLAVTAADIAAVVATGLPIPYVLVTVGNNDVWDEAHHADFVSNYLAVLDAWHTQFPLAQIGCNRPWANGKAGVDLVHTWIDEIVAARSSFVFYGPDEVTLTVPPDNGVTNFADGIHPNAAGYHLLAQDWQIRMGL